MMIGALLALAAGATAGIYLAFRHFTRKRLPAWVALLHGIGGATGFTIVLVTAVRMPSFSPIREVLYLLIATVVLGCVNLVFHLRKKRHRTSLILLHGMTAVSAASMLVRAIVLNANQAPADVAAPVVVASAPTKAEPKAKVAAAEEDVPAPDDDPAAPDDDPAAPDDEDAPPAEPEATRASASATPTPTPAPANADEPKPAAPAVDDATARVLEQAVTFETKSAEPTADSRSTLDEIAGVLKAHPEIALIEVQGHADERGGKARNVALTRARARKVLAALVARGVDADRLRAAGYGTRCPADPACQKKAAPESCHSAASWEKDRRVVFRVLRVGDTRFRSEVACARG